MSLTPHPRLYLGEPEQQRLARPTRHPVLRAAAAGVAELADQYVQGTEFPWTLNTHNAHLLRARHMQGRVVTLLVRWKQTGEARYRDAVMAHLRAMGRWEYWSWIAWRDGNAADDAIFDLSYGENSATLAIAYDWLFDTLSDGERRDLLAVAARPMAAFRKFSSPNLRAWWFGKPDTNWNTVCAGGAGMLALAIHEELPDAEELLARACESIEPFVTEIRAAHGAWPEGIGYWNYGMRYLYMFALSLERATGKRSPWLSGRAVHDSLAFPMRFAPHAGCGCSFGDVNHWSPLPFHFAAARRMRQTRTLAELELHLRPQPAREPSWPNQAELLCLHDGQHPKPPAATVPFLHHYRGQDWVVLADRVPAPRLYASVRGGTTEVPHGHVDLTSFHAVVGDEQMITSLGPAGYLDSTFSPRRWELFEMVPASKNVLLVDGVGISRPAKVATRSFISPWGPAVRLDAGEALGANRGAGNGVDRYHRLFVLMPKVGLLVVDSVRRPHPSLFEQRFCTVTAAKADADGFALTGQRRRARLNLACTEAAATSLSSAPMTRPAAKRWAATTYPTLLRWVTDLLHEELVFAALLTPGPRRVPLSVSSDKRGVEIAIGTGPRRRVLRLTAALLPRR